MSWVGGARAGANDSQAPARTGYEAENTSKLIDLLRAVL
jgi:hypothetical protein